MDPATIAAATVTILTPYVKDAGRELVKTVGQVALDKAKGLLGWLREKFEGDSSASKDLSRFETSPEKFEASLQATLEEKAQDPTFAAELKKRIDEIGPQIVVFQRIKEGKNITAIDAETINSGNITATQEGEKIENGTVLRVKTIG
jgi:hypothetical protein